VQPCEGRGAFHRWILILVAVSQQEVMAAVRELEERLLAVGLRSFIRWSEGPGERLGTDRSVSRVAIIATSDPGCDMHRGDQLLRALVMSRHVSRYCA